MRSRTIREGSVGLLILMGVGVFVGLVLWLRNFTFGDRTYRFTVTFADAVGLKEGATVRYRGVSVGRITEVKPQTNGVDTTVEITAPNLLIPKNVSIDANQSGFVGETSIDITPRSSRIQTPQNTQARNPQTSQCDSTLFICNKDRVNGQIGVSFIELLRSGTDLASRYSDPKFFDNVNTLTKNASVAATEAAKLSAELSLLSRSARRELGTVSTTARSLTTSANQTLDQVGLLANRFASTADKFGNTAEQYSLSGAQLNRLLTSANQLVVSNRGSLVGTLDSVRQTSDQLRVLLGSLTPTVNQINTTVGQLNTTTGQIRVGELAKNLEVLSSNAAQASANLRDITTSLNNPNNVTLLQQTLDNAVKVSANLRDITSSLNNPNNTVLLQQTLDSARATFENTQKITSDLDELTGDPAFRENVRKLVNGLGKLVSSTQQLQQQVQVAQQLEPVSSEINQAVASATAVPSDNQQANPNVEQAVSSTHLPLLLSPPAPKKPLPGGTSHLAAEVEREKR